MQQHYQVGHYEKFIMNNRAPKTVLQRDQETVIRSAFTFMCHYYKDAIDKVKRWNMPWSSRMLLEPALAWSPSMFWVMTTTRRPWSFNRDSHSAIATWACMCDTIVTVTVTDTCHRHRHRHRHIHELSVVLIIVMIVMILSTALSGYIHIVLTNVTVIM